MKLANFASLDPKITKTGRRGLAGASALDRKVWTEFNSDWTRLILEAEGIALSDQSNAKFLREGNVAFAHQPLVGPTTTTVTIEQRLGQNFFRRSVLANYAYTCCVTGIVDARLLNASHILPWSIDEKNRHNPKNGLCLSATFDRAFDRGLMGVDEAGRVRFSASLLESSSAETRSFFRPYDGHALREANRFDPDPAFLRWHHENCFQSDWSDAQ